MATKQKIDFKPMGREVTVDELGGMMRTRPDLGNENLIVMSVPRFGATFGRVSEEFRPFLATVETLSVRVGADTRGTIPLIAIVREGHETADLGALLAALALGHTVPDAFADQNIYEMESGIVLRPLVMQGGDCR